MYRLKKIKWNNRDLSIITQNENGPCPVLAVSNILLLKGLLAIHPDYSVITEEDLISRLTEYMLSISQQRNFANDEARLSYERNLNDAIALLPQLVVGLDVNIRFKNPRDFEFSTGLLLFDILGVELVHGWLPDPQDRVSYGLITKLSYNQLLDLLVSRQGDVKPVSADADPTKLGNSSPKDEPKASEPPPQASAPGGSKESPMQVDHSSKAATAAHKRDKLTTSSPASTRTAVQPRGKQALTTSLPATPHLSAADAATIGQFLEGSQLTVHGLMELHQTLKDNTFYVYYRNLHFSTLYKHKGQLYILVTDQGYSDKPEVVWERFDQVDGDTVFVDHNFQLFVQPSDVELASQLTSQEQKAALPAGGSSEDFARKLQEEEDIEFARQLQEQMNQEAQQPPAPQPQAQKGKPPKQLAQSKQPAPPPRRARAKSEEEDDGCSLM